MKTLTALTCIAVWGCGSVPDVTFVDTETAAEVDAGPDGDAATSEPVQNGPPADHGNPNRDR